MFGWRYKYCNADERVATVLLFEHKIEIGSYSPILQFIMKIITVLWGKMLFWTICLFLEYYKNIFYTTIIYKPWKVGYQCGWMEAGCSIFPARLTDSPPPISCSDNEYCSTTQHHTNNLVCSSWQSSVQASIQKWMWLYQYRLYYLQWLGKGNPHLGTRKSVKTKARNFFFKNPNPNFRILLIFFLFFFKWYKIVFFL